MPSNSKPENLIIKEKRGKEVKNKEKNENKKY